jgi:hypothetical protein
MKSQMWKALVGLLSVGAAVAARNAATAVWKRQVGHEPPLNPADPDTGWGEAAAWTVTLGVLAGLARLVARRGAASAWRALDDGHLPPPLEGGG